MRSRSPHRATTPCTSVSTKSALFAPLVKAYAKPAPGGGLGEIDSLLDTAAAHPAGPVQLDLTTAAASAPAEPASGKRRAAKTADKSYDLVTLAEARGLLAASARPLIVAGMEARGRAASAALRVLAQGLGCPVMTTYKAKGRDRRRRSPRRRLLHRGLGRCALPRPGRPA